MKKRLEFCKGSSSKFWEVEQRSNELVVTYGRIGTAGQSTAKSLASPRGAREEADKLIAIKMNKGYVDVALAKASKKKQARSRSKSKTAPRADDPFAFIGHGFGTSYKCIECYLWFERAPVSKLQPIIVELLPPPVAVIARFYDNILHFGSDDALEGRVKAQYGEKYVHLPVAEAFENVEAIFEQQGFSRAYVPTRTEWQRFCDDFERAVRTIHLLCKLRAVIKPDDGNYGKQLSSWHKRSLETTVRLAALGASSKPTLILAFLASNLIDDVIPSWPAAKRIPEEDRRAWLRWLDVLIPKRYDYLHSGFVQRAAWLHDAFAKQSQREVLEALRPPTRRAIEREKLSWKKVK